jgi:hypothetical protein
MIRRNSASISPAEIRAVGQVRRFGQPWKVISGMAISTVGASQIERRGDRKRGGAGCGGSARDKSGTTSV